jgi:L-lysine 2,3-aminomutase
MATPSWSTILSEMMTQPAALAKHLQLPDEALKTMLEAHQAFPLRVPKRWLDKIPPGAIDHPLLQQILPSSQEMHLTPGYSTDPLAEDQANPVPGLLHKYHGRVLLIAAPSCAIHCRYCFRRHFNYEVNQQSQEQWSEALSYIQQDKSIHEVILSGGDPLMLKNKPLKLLIEQINTIEHVQTLRIHSRMPVILPERIDQPLLTMLSALRLKVCMVIHCNHALELDDDVQIALASLQQSGTTLLNQSVLLQGVNSNSKDLTALSHRLWQCHTLPYYLHLPDKVQGTAHFDVTLNQARLLIKQISEKLPGYLVPKLAQEIPGRGAKETL